MNQAQGKVVVVLGMHRSGTSALTRGLTVLGVSLGENLMPANAGINAKGFWEDLEIVAINDALLAQLGLDWRSLGYFSGQHDWAALLRSDIAVRAEAYVKEQAGLYGLWGVKDPRMTRLIPFWQEIFRRCGLSPVYVVAIRHPLSVSASLTRRDGFPAAYGCYLWLDTCFPASWIPLPGSGWWLLLTAFSNDRVSSWSGLPNDWGSTCRQRQSWMPTRTRFSTRNCGISSKEKAGLAVIRIFPLRLFPCTGCWKNWPGTPAPRTRPWLLRQRAMS